MRRSALIALLAFVWTGAAVAQETRLTQAEFMRKAALGGMLEVELGQMAQRKGEARDVQYFGERMVKDHSKANDRLRDVARDVGFELPAELDAKHERKIEALDEVSGEAFDERYMDMMVRLHEKDVKMFEKAARSDMDPAVRRFARETLTSLYAHLSMARSIRAGLRR